MPEPTLSALIIAKNEAANLPGCLDSLAGLADEIIVVIDASSTDDSESIARLRACRVLLRPFDRFSSQRNAALQAASGDWVLSIDADERITPPLALEIRQSLRAAPASLAGFRIPIRSVILNRPFRYSGTQLDRPLRLFRRSQGLWIGEVHETVALEGPDSRLHHPIEHRTIPDLHNFLSKINLYTTLEARHAYLNLRKPSPFDLSLRPLWTFLKLYLLRLGLLDGPEGFLFCALSAVSAGIREWKLRELWKSAEPLSNLEAPQFAALTQGGTS